MLNFHPVNIDYLTMEVTLTSADGKSVCCNADILARHSEYIAAMLRSHMSESKSLQVKFEYLSLEQLSWIRDYVGHKAKDAGPVLTFENSSSVLSTLDYLCMRDAMQMCELDLAKKLTIENCDKLGKAYELVQKFNLVILKKAILQVLCQLYVMKPLSWKAKMLKKLPADYLNEIFMHDNFPQASEEKDIMELVFKWLVFNEPNISDVNKAVDLIFAPALELMHVERLDCCIQKLPYAKNASETLKNRIRQFQKSPHRYLRDKKDTSPHKFRKPIDSVFRYGGIGGCCVSTAVSYVALDCIDKVIANSEHLSILQCHESIEPTPVPLIECGTCTLDNIVYVAGGQSRYTITGKFAKKTVYRYIPYRRKWQQVAAMNEYRCLFYLGVLNNQLYAVGGINWTGVLPSVEVYNCDQDVWEKDKDLPYLVHEHAGCVLNNQLYISGGHDGTDLLNDVVSYDPLVKDWKRRESMIQRRSCHAMASVNGYIYAVGGCTMQQGLIQDIKDCEKYDPVTDQWTRLTNETQQTPMSCIYPIIRHNKIYCIGGYKFTNNQYVDMVSVFDPADQSWKHVQLISDLFTHYHQCCSIILDPSFFVS
ncbi:kelch 13 isoform X3 [Octopus vulgaris]|uniref:Kelch 13 isoform X3 n=2 Tax=Octopus TaxID=6643 RepID=A0AA36F2Z1_OCTVU|nr:kelch-like protein 9 [Octopus sinensis]CAI9723741.1 kelch 13 isoform X3 [Octopus vulgaris]